MMDIVVECSDKKKKEYNGYKIMETHEGGMGIWRCE